MAIASIPLSGFKDPKGDMRKRLILKEVDNIEMMLSKQTPASCKAGVVLLEVLGANVEKWIKESFEQTSPNSLSKAELLNMIRLIKTNQAVQCTSR